jgi:hypothetical protein
VAPFWPTPLLRISALLLPVFVLLLPVSAQVPPLVRCLIR